MGDGQWWREKLTDVTFLSGSDSFWLANASRTLRPGLGELRASAKVRHPEIAAHGIATARDSFAENLHNRSRFSCLRFVCAIRRSLKKCRLLILMKPALTKLIP
jgi:hypothetical protein